jgi:hypothetical protein
VTRGLFEPFGSSDESNAHELPLESPDIVGVSHGNYCGLVAGDLAPQRIDIPTSGQSNDSETVWV